MQSKALAVGADLCPCFAGLHRLGLWPSQPAGPATGGDVWRGVAAWLHASLLTVAHLVLPVTLAGNFLNCHFDSLDLFATNVFLFCGMGGVSLKALLFALDKRRFDRLLVQLQQTQMLFVDNAGARERCRKIATRLYNTQHSVSRFAVLAWVTMPAASGLFSGDAAAAWELPMPLCVSGVDVSLSPHYELLYVMQASCLFVAAEGMVLLDASHLTLMLNIAAELEVLNHNLVSIKGTERPKEEKCYHTNDRYPYSNDKRLNSNSSSADDTYVQLVDNIKHHQHIIRRARELESLMSGPTLVHLFYNLICISLSIVSVAVLLQTGGYKPMILKIMFVIAVFVSQLGFFCILGNNVIEQSEQLMMSAYSSYWPDANPRFKKTLLIFMTRALQPLQLRVGKLYPLSKETYLQILNASYSLFNLVLQTNGRN
ncbi:odorant receptor 43a-like [Schistocerca nitens]|uniref:odorant receptor 43a-like n=1 Tax=Schistocerca nitens TaxID=7011 RepID=UPI002117C4D6|nr:odorant receptor 43a-like [Schistocerca nitens]